MIHPYFNLTGDEAKGLLFGLLEVNKQQLRDHPNYPSMRELIRQGKVKYDQYDPDEHWQSYRELVEKVEQDGVAYGDCEDLATAVAAEDQFKGVPSIPYAYMPRQNLFHVVTAVPNDRYGSFGRPFPEAMFAPVVSGFHLEDPSAAAGMQTSFSGLGTRQGLGKPHHEAASRLRHATRKHAMVDTFGLVSVPFGDTSVSSSDADFFEQALDEELASFGAFHPFEKVKDTVRSMFDAHTGKRVEALADKAYDDLRSGEELKARRKVSDIIDRMAEIRVKTPSFEPSDRVKALVKWFRSGKKWVEWKAMNADQRSPSNAPSGTPSRGTPVRLERPRPVQVATPHIERPRPFHVDTPHFRVPHVEMPHIEMPHHDKPHRTHGDHHEARGSRHEDRPRHDSKRSASPSHGRPQSASHDRPTATRSASPSTVSSRPSPHPRPVVHPPVQLKKPTVSPRTSSSPTSTVAAVSSPVVTMAGLGFDDHDGDFPVPFGD